MKTITNFKNTLNTLLAFVFTMSISAVTFAQDGAGTVVEKTNETKTTTTTEWYADPVYLIAGAVILLIIVLLLTRTGKKKAD
jgi:hypothetical protein